MYQSILSLVLFLLLGGQEIVGQTLHYDAFFRGEKVGYMKVVEQKNGNTSITKSETHLKVSMVWSVEILMTFEIEFTNGTMVRSLTKSYKDGELDGTSNGYRQGARYIVNQDGTEKTVNSPEIPYCVTNIHFYKPHGVSHVYSERWGEFLKFEKESDGRYGLHLPNGNVNYYTYSGNVVRELEVNYGWFSMEFRLRG